MENRGGAKPGRARRGSAWQGEAGRCTVGLGKAWHGASRCDPARQGVAWLGLAGYVLVRIGRASRGMARQGGVRHGKLRRGTFDLHLTEGSSPWRFAWTRAG